MSAKKKTPRPAAYDAMPTLTEIAAKHTGVETLEHRGRDFSDFHDIGVAALRDALMAAYDAGVAAALEAK